jgi:prepilin-type N-terminal cleavage/methylation domain-containing protein
MMERRFLIKGFTLAEVIVGVAVFGVLVIGALTLIWTSHRILFPRRIEDGGRVLCVAPSATAFADAVVLHGQFMEQLKEARAVYVFGGVHPALPPEASQLTVKPLTAGELPVIADFTAGLPLEPLKFYRLYQNALGPMVTRANAEDFTVVVVGPRNSRIELTAMVQVRRSSLSVSDGDSSETFARWDVRYFDAAGNNSDYAFLEDADVAASAPVGAMHNWHRYQEGVVAEEGPVAAVFPDPWRHPGVRIAAVYQPPSFSRFIYLLHVTR